jgi:hypothetical protein
MAHNAGKKRVFPRSFAGTGFTLSVLVALTLAGCALFTPVPQVQVIVDPSVTPTVTHTLTPTWPAAWTVTPTFTPWPPTATPTPTYTPIPTITPTPCCGGRAPSQAQPQPGREGPLAVDFALGGVWCGGGGYFADFIVSASGGGGKYTYYRDCTEIGGPTDESVEYRLEWRECGGAPGTFFAKSADGQQAGKLFWVHPPSCCDDD